MTDIVFSKALAHYENKSKYIATVALPVIMNVQQNQGNQFKNIEIPLSDGKRALPVVVDMEEAIAKEGRPIKLELEKSTTLAMIDGQWKEHLRDMDDLRQSVQSAVYEQKDPLLIYKFESFGLFEQMIDKVNKRNCELPYLEPIFQVNRRLMLPKGRKRTLTLSRVTATKQEVAPGSAPDPRLQPGMPHSNQK